MGSPYIWAYYGAAVHFPPNDVIPISTHRSGAAGIQKGRPRSHLQPRNFTPHSSGFRVRVERGGDRSVAGSIGEGGMLS